MPKLRFEIRENVPESPILGIPTWKGLGSTYLESVPILSRQDFTVRGQGYFTVPILPTIPPEIPEEDYRWVLGPHVKGKSGTLVVILILPTAGTFRSLALLTDVKVKTKYIHIALDEDNRPLLEMLDDTGAVVAQVSPSFSALPEGEWIVIQFSWDAEESLEGTTRHARFMVNGQEVDDLDWTIDPQAPWDFFQPTGIWLGSSISTYADFPGFLHVQISNKSAESSVLG